MKPMERLEVGYAKSTDPEEARLGRVAGAFQYDERMEQLATLAETDPARFDRVSPTLRMGLGFYLSAKAAADAAGLDTTPPPKDTP